MGEELGQAQKLVQEVVLCWKKNADICRRATTGKLANVGNPKALTRRDVDCNADLLEPVLIQFGTSPALKYLHSCWYTL